MGLFYWIRPFAERIYRQIEIKGMKKIAFEEEKGKVQKKMKETYQVE